MEKATSTNSVELSSNNIKITKQNIKEIKTEIDLGFDLRLQALIDGKEVLEKKSDSFLSNFLKYLYFHMSKSENINLTDINSPFRILMMNNILRLFSDSSYVIESTLANTPLALERGVAGEHVNGFIVGFNDSGSGFLPDISDSVVMINDYNLRRRIVHGTAAGQLLFAGTSVSIPSDDAVKITRNITGNPVGSVLVKECGLSVKHPSYTNDTARSFILMRDLLGDGINIAANKILTLNYLLKIITTAQKGLLTQFVRLFYRSIKNAALGVSTISGSDNVGWNIATFFVAGGGGYTEWDGNRGSIIASHLEDSGGANIGIVIGTNGSDVNILQSALNAKIKHGSTAGKLFHHGNAVDGFTINTGNNTAQYDITRLFENLSGSSITVREIAIYCNSGSEQAVACIYREVLAPPQEIAPGELFKVKCTLKITA
ncbi:MAG: hypothetical protein QME52_13585 [Bacteroidota bacterium]|nr:hypothetical protein [Bacteroidota bacterium]